MISKFHGVKFLPDHTYKGKSIMMKMPIMTEEDFIRLANKQKNGKAAGTDGIRGEVYKHMITNKKIRKAMVRGINNLWYEKDYDTQDTQTKIQRT